jgi:hypothetical protein
MSDVLGNFKSFLETSFKFNQEGKEGFKTSSPEQTAKDEFDSFSNEMESFYPSKDMPTKVTKQETFKIDSIFDKLIQAESGGKQLDKSGKILTSSKGAEGVTQVMPKTQKDPGYGVIPAKDNSEGELRRVGREYLQAMFNKFNDWEQAVAAYNAGPGNVDSALKKAKEKGTDWKDHLPKRKETLPYIDKILGTDYSKALTKA